LGEKKGSFVQEKRSFGPEKWLFEKLAHKNLRKMLPPQKKTHFAKRLQQDVAEVHCSSAVVRRQYHKKCCQKSAT